MRPPAIAYALLMALAGDRDAEFVLIVAGDGFAKRRKSRRRAVVRGMVLDGPDAGRQGVARAGEGAVADLEFDDVLAAGLQAPGHGEDVEGSFGG